ncbi:hypothetical protein A3A93_05020 [Candidatus Roizmanbacteria bacterium RIFCSPLOWO2_01_FULL_38_12]|uniref:Integrase catalytic domain-containing protein n=1 Tax=Candidatus Roizmanbacteria bacterium RIFCSPLOWO2_01_FULL_38_12 TaxID=1802061 RepID=A0A1F7J0T1_9BACT|nr:MAG: hypothetical protein A3A93_05020 [Candidatus Roizmanbacteria bacterium RIFCSPLOWO2_01_FULL_38_12]
MTLRSKKEYLATMRERYLQAGDKKTKTELLDQVVAVLGIHRKHAVRTLNKRPLKRVLPRTPHYQYGLDLILPLQKIWEIAGRPCSKRLEPQIPALITQLKKFYEIILYGRQEELLCKMSHWTIDQLLKPERERLEGKGISGTRRSPLLKSLIPIRTDWDDVKEPGHIEMDCVLHCGESVSGVYAETVNMIDIDTHWNERRMILKKTNRKVIGVVHKVRGSLPFPLLSIDFDNGSEFVNWGMHGYCTRDKIAFTRSRPYKKNDQAHIEGKNYQSVRRVTGYGRITDEKIVAAFNDLYEQEHRLLTNFFYTTLKLKKKERRGTKIYKSHEKAQTPYQRILQSKQVSDEIKQKLKNEYESLNPAALHRSLQKKLKKIRQLRE